jgi:predicted ATPase
VDLHTRTLRQLLAGHLVVPVVGSGVSTATAGIPGWIGIIEDGLNHAAATGLCSDADLAAARVLLHGAEPDLISAAQLLRRLLGAPHGEYPTWLKQRFEVSPAEVRTRRVVDSIVDLLCPLIATTNYDKLISILHFDAPRLVTWRQAAALQTAVRDGRAILHLHGVYDDPLSVILGIGEYNTLARARAYGTVLRMLWLSRTLLFIGCSFDGLQDPDFSKLLQWTARHFAGSEYKHYALFRSETFSQAQVKEYLLRWRIQIIGYGQSHDDLPRWLESLNPHREEATRLRESRARSFYSPGPRGRASSGYPMPRGGRASPRHNLPEQLTPFIGRVAEITAAVEQLMRPDVHLLTFTGPGGGGKTRLALEVARRVVRRFPDGVYFVLLASIRDPELISSEIVRALGIQESGESPIDAIRIYLQGRRLLLILDNFEHLIRGSPLVTALFVASQQLKILVTSREALNAYGEQLFHVPPLPMPDIDHLPPLSKITQYDAVRLFRDRARAVKMDFKIDNENAPAVAELCYRLDGLPLAIELAAARVKILPPEAMLQRLGQRLPFITGGPHDLPARQQTLRATIAWSYDLLPPEERIFFRRLGVFVGGCTIEAAERVCNVPSPLPQDVLTGIQSLVDKSLLETAVQIHGREPRFLMLETVREYATEQLQTHGEADALAQMHLEYFLMYAERAAESLRGADQELWLIRLEQEHGNLTAALAYSETPGVETSAGLRLSAALGWFWYVRSYYTEGRRYLDRALLAGAQEATSARAKALWGCGFLARHQGALEDASRLFQEALALARALVDRANTAEALSGLGLVAWDEGRFSDAVPLLEESLDIVRSLHEPGDEAMALYCLGVAVAAKGDEDRAARLLEECLALSRKIGYKYAIALALESLGRLAYSRGDRARAALLLKESLALCQELRYKRGIAWSLDGLGLVAHARDDPQRAVQLLAAAEVQRLEVNIVMPPSEQPAYDHELTTLRAVLGETDFRRAWTAAHAIPIEQSIANALASDSHEEDSEHGVP